MFSNSLKMVKLDRNMSELWKIVRKMYNVNINVFFCYCVNSLLMLEHKYLEDSVTMSTTAGQWPAHILSQMKQIYKSPAIFI